MNTGKTLFAQLMDFLPWTTFTRIVDRYGGDHRVRTLSCAEQYRSLAFAQLTYRESLCVDREAGLDVAPAFPVGQLGEGQGPVLLGAGKRPDPVIAAIPVDDPRESSPWQEVHELSEQGLAGVHEHLLGETPKSAPSNSNRHPLVSG